jgi:hypothetical protein
MSNMNKLKVVGAALAIAAGIAVTALIRSRVTKK